MIRVVLPFHLRRLAGHDGEVVVELDGAPTIARLLDALEARHPVLRGTVRETGTLKRRAYVRYFACKRDLSHEPADCPLPDPVVSGEEPFRIVGAMSGG
jgi:hypothetical protein